ncbi:MAG: hypothetical protein IPI02_01105 [Sterolibacteriaceae bacterium]|nr:hypothetical protein [Sterolibacteriaceae bacterium]
MGTYEKGRVERGVGYVKGNFLAGLDLPEFAALNPALRLWLESVANVRLHRETHRRASRSVEGGASPFAGGQSLPFDVGWVLTLRANRQFRVSFEGNRYSVPARFAGSQVTEGLSGPTLRVSRRGIDRTPWPLIGAAPRHRGSGSSEGAAGTASPCARRPRAQALPALSLLAAKYHAGLLERRGNAISHVRKIVALAEIHGDDPVLRAMTDALAFEAFSSEYIAHLIEARAQIARRRARCC